MNGFYANDLGEIIIEKISGWWTGFLTLLPNIAAGLFVLLLFYALSRLARLLTRSAARRWGLPDSLQRIITGLAGVVVFIIGIIVGLSVLGLKKTVTTALAGAGVLGLALGFALQDVAANFISGMFLVFRRPFIEGDVIEIKDQLGTVLETNLRATKLRTPNGETIYVPNQDLFQNDVTNYSELGVRRVEITCGVGYGEDLNHVQEVAENVINDLPFAIDRRPVEVYFDEFGDSGITFSLWFWIDFSKPIDYPQNKDKAIQAIKSTFEDENIEIPYPTRTIGFTDDTDHPQK